MVVMDLVLVVVKMAILSGSVNSHPGNKKATEGFSVA